VEDDGNSGDEPLSPSAGNAAAVTHCAFIRSFTWFCKKDELQPSPETGLGRVAMVTRSAFIGSVRKEMVFGSLHGHSCSSGNQVSASDILFYWLRIWLRSASVMDTVLVIDTVPVMATDLALGVWTRLRAAIMATGGKTCRTHVTEFVKTCRTHVTEFVKTCRAHVTELCSCEWYSASSLSCFFVWCLGGLFTSVQMEKLMDAPHV